jgi:Raf kinase inhibitor-like YbhB/YbcL family protein
MRSLTLPAAILALLTMCAFSGPKSLVVTSSAFTNNNPIPVKYTCMGAEFSPPISVANIPPGAKSLAIIVDDPDATATVMEQKVCVRKNVKTKKGAKQVSPNAFVQTKVAYTHWLIWNIDVDSYNLPENFKNDNEGMNSANLQGYKGMCPPTGATHHYHFKVYALDTKLNIGKNSDKACLEKVMQGHIVATGELVGIFNKNYK